MSFLSGILLIDCPASALNNHGKSDNARTDNVIAVKKINSREGVFPYVSAQAFRYWWRETLKGVDSWTSTPVFREKDIAYTDANPILYAEDDLFGYMRAQSKKTDAKKQREEEGLLEKATLLHDGVTLTRQSPLKVSSLISIGPLKSVTYDYGVMARQEGFPVPYEHEFYRTTLNGIFSVDLGMAGTFYHINRTGFKHLDDVRVNLAKEKGLEEVDNGKAYQLPVEARCNRIAALLEGLARITGGAKLSVHYTDVMPKFVVLAISKGGNHLFSTLIGADNKGLPVIKLEALKETVRVYKDEILSGIYVGLVHGYLDDQRQALIDVLNEISSEETYNQRKTFLGHPREAIEELIKDLRQEGELWLK